MGIEMTSAFAVLKDKLEWLDSREGERATEIEEQLVRDYGVPISILRTWATLWEEGDDDERKTTQDA